MPSRSISVKVAQGLVIGETAELPNGNSYSRFKGIPYAEPPVGPLRFKPPKSLKKFPKEILKCVKEGNLSFQWDPFSSNLVGTEDCLYLNIYMPNINSQKLLPVMVWIHGGAFSMGSGNSDFYLPEYLLQEDVIIVTLNYRLGIFGFLYFPEHGVPGNAGLMDQLIALKWIKENIHQFSGDANNITLFGQSAGAASIHLHLLSSNSQKYFHKAICQSGTSNMEWVIQNDPIVRTRCLAKLMGCESTDDNEIIKFLKTKENLVDFIKNGQKTLTNDEKRRGLPIPFKPVIEKEYNEETIVNKPPLESAMKTNSIRVPVMMGYTSKEGLTMIPHAIKNLKEIDQDFERMIPRSINLATNDPKCSELSNEMKNFYFKGKNLSENILNEYADLLTDYHFGIGIHIAAEIHARRQHSSPLFFYRFSYSGGLNYYKKWFNTEKFNGACHGDELFYLFQMDLMKNRPKPGSNDEKIVKALCRLWTNFAKYSNPTPDEDTSLTFKWNPVKQIEENDKFELDYLEIDQNIEMKSNPDKERIDFWRNAFKKYNNSFLRPKL